MDFLSARTIPFFTDQIHPMVSEIAPFKTRSGKGTSKGGSKLPSTPMDRVETPFNGSVLEIPRKTPLFSRWHSLMNSLPGSSIDHFREKDLFVFERSGFSRWHHVDPIGRWSAISHGGFLCFFAQIIRVDWLFTCWPVKKPQISWKIYNVRPPSYKLVYKPQ